MARERDERLERAVAVFGRAARLLDVPRLHVWDERGLTLPQLRILFQVRQAPGLGVKELARAFDVSASNVTQQVDKLVARGLMARAERPDDRRQVLLSLTDEGERLAGEVSQAARGYLRDLLDQLSPNELDELTRALDRVLALAAPPAGPVADDATAGASPASARSAPS